METLKNLKELMEITIKYYLESCEASKEDEKQLELDKDKIVAIVKKMIANGINICNGDCFLIEDRSYEIVNRYLSDGKIIITVDTYIKIFKHYME